MSTDEGRFEKRKLIVLAMHDADVVVVTPRTLDRARGVLGDRVVATRDIAGQVGFGYLWDAIEPCFASVEHGSECRAPKEGEA